MPQFKTLNLFTTALSVALGLVLMFAPGIIYWLFQIPVTETADFAFRRASLLFLILALVCYGTANIDNSATRIAISRAATIGMGALAILGFVEFARGFAGLGILLAVAVEVALAALYLNIWRKERSQNT